MNNSYKNIRIITNLYYNERTAVQIEERLREEINIKRGVTQGCILSPTLFNPYSENNQKCVRNRKYWNKSKRNSD